MAKKHSVSANGKPRNNGLSGGGSESEVVELKDFTYRLPKDLGNTFKLWCQTNGFTAQNQLKELMTDFMDGKEIVIRYNAK